MSGFDDEVPMLSAATLAALRQFASSSGIEVEDEEDDENIVASVRSHFDVHDRNQTFHFEFKNDSQSISFSVKGVKRELGQTLNSTGLTIWRAAEHLCDWVFANQSRFEGKSICELGAGLGMVSILLSKLGVCSRVVCTDGCDDTVALLRSNIEDCDAVVEGHKLYWGEMDSFVETFPDKFDILCAADVIYEKEQILPLITTVVAILAVDGEFLLAFARRNVPMDLVFQEADRQGLAWEVVDLDPDTNENIYSFRFRP